MLYLRSAEDLFEVVELYTNFGAEVPCFVDPVFESRTHLRTAAGKLTPLNSPANGLCWLAFDPRTASWCYLSEPERAVWEQLRQGAGYREITERPDGITAEDARDLLVHLYRRGLLEVDGKPSLAPDIFEHGPLFRRAYLIEVLLTEACNLGCRYCYARAGPGRDVMPPETLRRTVDLAMALPSEGVTIQFAGGETFTHFAGLQQAVSYIEDAAARAGKEPDIICQTNGTLLTPPGVIDFLREHNISVGISLDGPRAINDLSRPYPDGGSSYADTLAGLQAVREAGYEVVGTLSVVGRHNVEEPEKLLDYFAELGVIGVRFNPIIRKGRGESAWDAMGITPREYFEFMKAVTEYLGRTHAFTEGNLESLVRNLVLRTRNFRCMRSPCGAGVDYMAITPEGDVYPCVHWLRQPELCLGNVAELESLEWAFLNSSVVCDMTSRIVAKIPGCDGCRWRHLCEAGCGLDALEQHGDLLTPAPLCEFYREMYPFLLDYLAGDPALATFLLPEVERCPADGGHG